MEDEFQVQARDLAERRKALTKSSHTREWRRLYSDVELLRIDVEEKCRHIKASKGNGDDPGKGALLQHLESVQKQLVDLRDSITLSAKAKFNVMMIVRIFALLSYILLFAMPLMAVLSPLRLAHPLLRALGWHNNWLPLDLVTKMFARGFLAICGVRVIVEGLENLDVHENTVAMFSHASNLDPFIVQGGCPILFKWIGKKELFRLPVFGWVAWLYGNISIDRENLEKAKQSLAQAAAHVHRWGRSVGISPEGTRSKTGLLLDFKKGPFHLARAVARPVTPASIFGAYEGWPPGQIFSSGGLVCLRFLPAITFKEDTPLEDMQVQVRRAMLHDQASPPAWLGNEGASALYKPGSRYAGEAFTVAMLTAVPLFWAWYGGAVVTGVMHMATSIGVVAYDAVAPLLARAYTA